MHNRLQTRPNGQKNEFPYTHISYIKISLDVCACLQDPTAHKQMKLPPWPQAQFLFMYPQQICKVATLAYYPKPRKDGREPYHITWQSHLSDIGFGPSSRLWNPPAGRSPDLHWTTHFCDCQNQSDDCGRRFPPHVYTHAANLMTVWCAIFIPSDSRNTRGHTCELLGNYWPTMNHSGSIM